MSHHLVKWGTGPFHFTLGFHTRVRPTTHVSGTKTVKLLARMATCTVGMLVSSSRTVLRPVVVPDGETAGDSRTALA